MKKTEKKKKEKDAAKERPATTDNQTVAENRNSSKDSQSSSTPRKKQKGKLKKMDMSSKPKDILGTFQNRNLASTNWETLADQVLKRGVQKGPTN